MINEDEDGIARVAYEFDESTLPYGFYKDVDFSKTTVTISAASLIKKAGGKHGGGKIVVQPGATIKKEKKAVNVIGNKKGKSNSNSNSNLRGSSDTLFDRKLSQKIGDRYVDVVVQMCVFWHLDIIVWLG